MKFHKVDSLQHQNLTRFYFTCSIDQAIFYLSGYIDIVTEKINASNTITENAWSPCLLSGGKVPGCRKKVKAKWSIFAEPAYGEF